MVIGCRGALSSISGRGPLPGKRPSRGPYAGRRRTWRRKNCERGQDPDVTTENEDNKATIRRLQDSLTKMESDKVAKS